MSSVYGGSMQKTFPKVSAKKVAKHGMKHFMYLNLKYHPYAPQCPGGGGLWFNPDPEWRGDPLRNVQRVFTRDLVTAMWQYMGQYEIKAAPSLTLAEWLGLEEVLFELYVIFFAVYLIILQIRYNWATEIREKEWGRKVCARIQARKEVGPDREPDADEVQAVMDSGRWKSTTPEEVRIAFDCGKEASH
jgi:hypothetical protein